MHMRRRSSLTPTGSNNRSSSGSRRKSLVEVAEAHFDKNTIILVVNVVILLILIAILYLVATSTMNAAINPYTGHEHYYKHDKADAHSEN